MPPVAIAVVEKTFVGAKWSNTHGVAIAHLASNIALTNAHIAQMVGSADDGFTDVNTDPDNAAFAGPTSILAAILAFERRMHPPQVRFTRLYLSDGSTPGAGTGLFATFPLNFAGLRSLGSASDIAALNNVLEVNRVPRGFSARVGHLQLRACIGKSSLLASAGDGVELDPAGLLDAQAALALALTDSSLSDYFDPDSNAGGSVIYVIPKYAPATVITHGAVSFYNLVQTLTVNQAMSRQLRRGKRRKKVLTEVPA